ncbi:MAG: two-component system, cell cycle response regulator [Chloroflexota bacterium]|nr:two-component system, cell cycle response regulator [Chloroflexota bacterium]
MVRAVVRAGLEEENYQIVEAVDGIQALQQCRHHPPPDVVLLDIEMPGLDGYEVLAELKAAPDLRHIPVVFLTNRTGMQDVLAGLRGGAHDYLKKPFEPAELVARVRSAIRIKQLQDELRQRNADLERMTRTDVLTGLCNRRHLEEVLAGTLSAAVRRQEPMAVLLLDIDHFKHVNDTFGHPVGDLVLMEFARRLSAEVRAGEVAGRWGGEEFLVILPRADLVEAVTVAERIRIAIAATPMAGAEHDITVTVSVGCGIGPCDSAEELLRIADERLYEAKLAGRNRTVAVARGHAGIRPGLNAKGGSSAALSVIFQRKTND